MRDFNAAIQKAQQLQEERLINFCAVGLATAGGKFKADEAFKSIKRFQRNWHKGAAVLITNGSTLWADAELNITIPEDRWSSIGQAHIELYNETAVVVNGKVCGQLFRLAKLEIKPPSGNGPESGSLRAHTFGFEQVQGEADEIEMSAAQFRHLNEGVKGEGEFVTPLGFANPGESVKLRIHGLTGTTIADSFTGNVYAVPHILTYDGVKG